MSLVATVTVMAIYELLLGNLFEYSNYIVMG